MFRVRRNMIQIVPEVNFQARRHFGTYDVTACLPMLSDNYS